jgi:hypothetical protein
VEGDDGKDHLVRVTALQLMSDSLLSVGESPVKLKGVGETKYPIAKLAKIDVLKRKTFQILPDKIPGPSTNDESEILLQQLKEKFLETTHTHTKNEVTILTLLPKNWSIRKVQSDFPSYVYMIRKAKNIVKEQGILSLPDPKPGRTLPPAVVV